MEMGDSTAVSRGNGRGHGNCYVIGDHMGLCAYTGATIRMESSVSY